MLSKYLFLALLPSCVIAFPSCNLTSVRNLTFNCDNANLSNCMTVGSISLRCNSNSRYSVSLTQGASGNFVQRFLVNTQNPNQKIPYNIFTSPNKIGILGDGTQGSSNLTGTCSSCTINFYGFISNVISDDVLEGYYQDNLILTINYQ